MRVSQREKIWICAGAVFLLSALSYIGLIHPAMERVDAMEARIQVQKEGLRRILDLQREWKVIQRDRRRMLQQLAERGPEFSMFRHLEELARRAGVEKHIQYMRPLPAMDSLSSGGLSRLGLEVSLKNVGLGSLIRYLYHIEYSDKLLRIESIQFKPVYTSPNLINVTFRVVTLQKA